MNLSSSYHPQTDGQTDGVNQILEQYLRCSLSYQQDDWIDLLPLAEFTYNNTLHGSTGVTPFFGNYSFHPCFNISIVGNSVNRSAEARAHTLANIHQGLSLELILADDRYKAQADRHRSSTRSFVVGDQVWLLCRHIDTTRPCRKLDYKKLGHFRIIEHINPHHFSIGTSSTFSDSLMFSMCFSLNLIIHPLFLEDTLLLHLQSSFPQVRIIRLTRFYTLDGIDDIFNTWSYGKGILFWRKLGNQPHTWRMHQLFFMHFIMPISTKTREAS